MNDDLLHAMLAKAKAAGADAATAVGTGTSTTSLGRPSLATTRLRESVLKLIASQAKLARRIIPHAVVLTRTSAAMKSRSLKNVSIELEEAGIPVFETAIVERAAYRDLFDFGGTLPSLDSSQTSNLEKAIENARQFTGELVAKIKETVA